MGTRVRRSAPSRAARRALRKAARAAWTSRIAHARRAIRRCKRLMQFARTVLRVSNRFGTEQPLRAHHHFERAGAWLVRGTDQLGRAVDDLNFATFAVAMAPQDAARAFQEMLEIARYTVEAGVQLADISERLTQRSTLLVEAAKRGAGRAPRVPPPLRLVPPRNFLIPSPESIVLQRRQRPPPPAQEDAPRSISRGRAPPFRSACSL